VKDPINVLKDDEAAAILEGEAGGGKWTDQRELNPSKALVKIISQATRWVNTNTNIAYFGIARQNLVVETPEVEALLNAQKEQQEKQRKGSIPKF
jgi:hypothetical protein